MTMIQTPRMTDHERLVHAAAALGKRHREAGTAPFGDVFTCDTNGLLEELGECGPVTAGNALRRFAAKDAYFAALDGGPEPVIGDEDESEQEFRDYWYAMEKGGYGDE